MENIEIVHINNYPYKDHIEDIAEIVFESVKSKYIIIFDGNVNGIREMIFNQVKKGLLPLDDAFLAINKDDKKPVGILVLLSDKKIPIFRSIKHSIKLMFKLGNKKIKKLSKSVMIIDDENQRFKDSDNVTFINLLAVNSNYRRLGIGKSLINFASDNIKSRCKCLGSDCSCKINLICSSKGFIKKFYSDLGFKELLEVEYNELSSTIGEEYERIVHMSKYL